MADIVAVVQNQGRDIMNFWSEEKLTLEDRSKTSKKFLVRIRGNVDAFKERIGNDFGEVRFVEAGVNGEFGFVTPVMTEGESKSLSGNPAYDKSRRRSLKMQEL